MRFLFLNKLIRHPELVSGSHKMLKQVQDNHTNFQLNRIKQTLFFGLFFFISVALFSQTVPERPSPQRLVNNLSVEFPKYLSEEEEQTLENKLENFSNETSNQICVLIIDSLWGFSTADFCERIITNWGVGKKDKNNGIVILIKPTGGAGERDAFIATGYGLEGAIPDLTCKKIVDNELIPNLKNGKSFKALDEATTVLIALAKGEYNSKDYNKKINSENADSSWRYIFIGLFILIFLIRIFKRSGFSSFTGSGPFYGGGFGGGSWGGGSSGGGGWGGFGGGSGGGGGAGGKW